MNMNKPHKHAALMLQFAQDAQETETPWERWQYKSHATGKWSNFYGNPGWKDNYEYRRKPIVIIINGIEVPEPMREKPEIGDIYYVPQVRYTFVEQLEWAGNGIDIFNLNSGLVHLTESAALSHGNALLSFTKKEETK